ncbi:NUDIX domain-containing protein [Arcanobacterium canis]|uniref:Bifunctional NUDIX hydrolase/histidine phosphatase family protein n=1 Tax=Arcanobacterium canis TaxID=999183 RepID=A0ABY8FXF2_9ACTO|nr:bifunctional NUDIX hydrolase/histidine phosphatase family protein [Arcanobacterium canis]WFM83163.1 bifunctional NUDIX hydrolase/histidine phosphatase family protein [Arcanobacterium canis]
MSALIDVHAAGAVVWRVRQGILHVLLIHRPKWNDWSFPKGKVKTGESLVECAVREVTEEARIVPILGQPLGWQYYDLPDGRHKEVRYWAATVAPPRSPIRAARPRGWAANKGEIDDRRWVTVSEAEKKLTRDGDRKILSKLIRAYSAGTLETTPIVLVRHTRAKSRSSWAAQYPHATEHNRPLTKVGTARARHLVSTLGAYGIQEIISSPWIRCVDTVAPYARAIDSVVRVVDALTESAFAADPQRFTAWMRNRFEQVDLPEVISLHRPTLPAVMDVLQDYTRSKVFSQIPKKDPWLKTGEMIIAHVARRPLSVASSENSEQEGNTQNLLVSTNQTQSRPRNGPTVVALERLRPSA